MYGMNVARYHQFPDIKTDGMYGLPRLIVLTSDHVRTTCESQSELRPVHTYRLRLRVRQRLPKMLSLCQWRRTV